MIYLYAIVDRLDGVRELRGLEGEALDVLTFEGVRVVAGTIHTAPDISRERLAAQDQIVRALHHRAAALLPMRFGAVFRSEEDAARAVALHASGLGERLARVRRREQMTLRVPGAPGALGATGATGAPGAPGAAGTEYLRERARPREIAPLLDALGPIVRATIVERGKAGGVLSVYHLIDRGSSDEYRRLADAVVREQPAYTVHVSGPSPCYAFT